MRAYRVGENDRAMKVICIVVAFSRVLLARLITNITLLTSNDTVLLCLPTS